jgi:hypothetical protein
VGEAGEFGQTGRAHPPAFTEVARFDLSLTPARAAEECSDEWGPSRKGAVEIHTLAMDEIPPIDDMVLASEVRGLGRDDRRYRREVATGQLVRLHRGAFVPKSVWDFWTPQMRYQMRCIGATISSRTHAVLSHESAAAIHQIPMLGAFPKLVHVPATVEAGTRTEHGFRKHATRFPEVDVESRGELRLTNLDRTLVEFATTTSFPGAVAAFDWALRPAGRDLQPRTSRDSILKCAARLGLTRGRVRLLRALEFANPLSESPGESFSRAIIHELGFPPPQLQKAFSDSRGFIGRVDFWWPEHNLVGEFDGIAKYIREEYARGMTPAQVVVAEKIREDRIRATGPRFARWEWDYPANPQRLFNLLKDAGLPSWRRSAYRHQLAK